MVGIGGLNSTLNQYNSVIKKSHKRETIQDVQGKQKEPVKKADNNESKLSAKAQEYLNKLREKYKDYDFIITDEDDDKEGLLNKSDKDYSVMISSEEIEKMAKDDEYSNKMLAQMESAIDISKKISDEYGYIKQMTIDILGDGNIRFLAELVSGKKINAESEEDMRNQLNEIDWDKFAAEVGDLGIKIDYSV